MGFRDRLVQRAADLVNEVLDQAQAQSAPNRGLGGVTGQSIPMQNSVLDQFVSVVLDANGNGVVQAGPARVKEHWQPNATYVSVQPPASGPVSQATATLFVGTSLQNSTQAATTATGSTGDTCGTPGLDLAPGYQLFIQWEGGNPGQLATAHIMGTIKFGPGA